MKHPDLNTQTAEDFWEGIYNEASSQTSGHPSSILKRFAADRTPGEALDLGCAKGDDIVWLAKHGWEVLGVDIAASALRIAKENAERNQVSHKTRFEQHDLANTFPNRQFDLISAMFLETPLAFPRATVFERAASTLRPSGLLLIATHQTLAPWAWGDSSVERPCAEVRLAELNLDTNKWRQIFVGSIQRMARGPDRKTAQVKDAVLALEKI